MIVAALNWCWIGLSAFLWGYAFLHILNKFAGYKKREPDVACALGICSLTVYAQAFSLFYKVGAVATGILLVINIAVGIWLHKEIWEDIRALRKNSRKSAGYIVILAVSAGLILVLTSQKILHYDTFLYHAQSIRWIEEYGIVRGLGNLHNRLAYNSSVFCLEALFGMKFLMGRSLHNVNGFVIAVLLGYTLCSFKVIRSPKIWASDCLRVAMLFFIGYWENLSVISSSGSDLLALGLVVYILIKWISYLEDGEQEIAPFAYLCILGVYAFTVKLSAAMIVLLVIMPAVKLIRQKKRIILVYIAVGFIVALPFLVRNVIISGYLIYPYPELDLFAVDWKMPEYTLLFDRNEIKAWGWGLNDVFQFDAPISVWFPVWFGRLSTAMQNLFLVNIVLIAGNAIAALYQAIKRRDIHYPVIIVTMSACFAMWFIGSPLTRYGSVYMVILPAFTVGVLLGKFRWCKKIARVTVLVLVICFVLPIWNRACSYGLTNHKLHSPDYYWKVNMQEMTLGNENIYVPIGSDQAGYYAFPSTPYGARLELIELRGDTLEDGFRMKEEYRDANVSTYGQVYEDNIFE